jgi:hypothetical protein
MPQQPVYKPNDMSATQRPCLFRRLIDDRGFGDSIHKINLVKGDPQDVQDRRLNLSKGEVDRLLDDPVQPESPPENPLNEVDGKGTIPLRQIGIIAEYPV